MAKKSNRNKYDVFTDSYSFWVPLLIQIIVVTISLFTIAPDWFTGIAFSGLGAGAVLFAPRAFKKGLEDWYEKAWLSSVIYFINWALLASFSIFIGVSFALAETNTQTTVTEIRITAENDLQLQIYQDRIDENTANRDDALAQYELPGLSRDHYAFFRAEYERYGILIDEDEDKYDARLLEIDSGQATRAAQSLESTSSANTVFTSISDSVEEKNLIPLWFWAVLMIGSELTIINALRSDVKRPKKKALPTIVQPSNHKPSEPTNIKTRRKDFIKKFVSALFENSDLGFALSTYKKVSAKIDISEREFDAYISYGLENDLLFEENGWVCPQVSEEKFLESVESIQRVSRGVSHADKKNR
jgi:hypothetical protein